MKTDRYLFGSVVPVAELEVKLPIILVRKDREHAESPHNAPRLESEAGIRAPKRILCQGKSLLMPGQ